MSPPEIGIATVQYRPYMFGHSVKERIVVIFWSSEAGLADHEDHTRMVLGTWASTILWPGLVPVVERHVHCGVDCFSQRPHQRCFDEPCHSQGMTSNGSWQNLLQNFKGCRMMSYPLPSCQVMAEASWKIARWPTWRWNAYRKTKASRQEARTVLNDSEWCADVEFVWRMEISKN